jgi:hypothetical protein
MEIIPACSGGSFWYAAECNEPRHPVALYIRVISILEPSDGTAYSAQAISLPRALVPAIGTLWCVFQRAGDPAGGSLELYWPDHSALRAAYGTIPGTT